MNKKKTKTRVIHPEECSDDIWLGDEERNIILGIEKGETTFYHQIMKKKAEDS